MKTNLLSNPIARAAFGLTVCASIAMACSARDRGPDGTTARVSQVSQAISSNPLVWPTTWTPIKQGSSVLTDPTGDAQGSRDVVGTDAAPAAFIASDADRIFFRMRLGSTPLKTTTSLNPFGWACEFDVDADHTNYEFIANVNGIIQNDAVLFSQNTTQGTIDSPSDKAELTLQTYSALVDNIQNSTVAHARVVDAGTDLGGTGGDFFIDWAIDVNDFPASFSPLTTPFRLVCGSSANAQNISSDPLSPSGATTLSALDSDPLICSATGCADACFVDTDCGSTLFCNTQTHTCTPKLANGVAIPTITGHTPDIAGTCTTAVGTSVCVSGVCDTADNLCGFANGDGTCDAANAGVVCRSGACGVDNKCAAPAGCTTDANCAATQFCDTSSSTCVAKLANGIAIPTIAGHTPDLNGTCTTDVGTSVCAAAVCDADNLCGFANGTGPCTAGNAATVCRSSTCSPNGGKCIPAGGCLVDADCASTEYCDNSVFACTPKVVNGAGIPSITGHDPALTGACTAAAGTAVCAAGVCDTDNLCGLASGTSGCTVGNGGTVCRSGVCSATGICQGPAACTADSDCASTQFCNTGTSTCVAKLGNGIDIPTIAGHTPALTGVCDAAVGTSVCTAGVCDTADNKCGFANGDGTCTAGTGGTVCRSGSCGGDSICGRQGGETCGSTTECRVGTCTGGTCQVPVACTNDAMCAATEFCNTATSTCVAKLGNGTAIPTIAGHTPDLNGVCSAAVGTAVCAAGVCDTTDNKCGFANGNGTCTAGTGGTVCRSGSCGSDGVCGRKGGETCTGATECRVGTCTAGVCPTATDGGAPDSGTTPDAGVKPSDAGTTPPPADAAAPRNDAGVAADASTPDEDGVLEGGGISCAQSPRSARGGDLAALCFGALGLASLRRRRRR
jgi:hypothetical protein